MKRATSLLIGLSVFGGSAASWAANPMCGRSKTVWNVPTGGAVFTTEDSPISPVINAIGETRSHVVLAASSKKIRQTTMTPPRVRGTSADEFCDAPLVASQLEYGYPGAEEITVSAYQSFTHDATWRSYQVAKYTDTPTEASAAIGLANVSAYQPTRKVASRYNASNGGEANQYLYLIDIDSDPSPYYLNQFMNSGNASYGGSTKRNGLVCSTYLARAQADWAKELSDYKDWVELNDGLPTQYKQPMPAAVAHRFIKPHTYSHAVTVSAGRQLYSAVKSQCAGESGFFQDILEGVGSVFLCFDWTLCDQAANQVRNCMAFGSCNYGGTGSFENAEDDSSFKASSISPDWLGGWVSGQDYDGHYQSVWAEDYNHNVQFSGDLAYDCWI